VGQLLLAGTSFSVPFTDRKNTPGPCHAQTQFPMKKKANSRTDRARRQDSNHSVLREEWQSILVAARANPLPPQGLHRMSAALPETSEHDGHLLIRHFKSDDLIWLGPSKSKVSLGRLVVVRELLRLKPGPNAFIISNAFRSAFSTFRRDTPVTRRFLTLSTPRQPLAVQGALLYLLREHLRLVAIVVAGAHSLEGWYRWKPEWDEPAVREQLQERLAGLGFGDKCLNPLRTWHLPGVVNPLTNFTQSLLYLNPNHE
jgi:hypothetical protein